MRQLPSLNTILGKQHFAIHKINKEWHKLTREAVISQVPVSDISYFRNRIGEDGVRYRIMITAYLYRLYDEDNLHAKMIVDALKGYIITDDAPEYATIAKRQVKIFKRSMSEKVNGGLIGSEPYTAVEIEILNHPELI